ncbi:hypothetical protein F4775DRAFT_551631 [Biscogniauxia sp. FL1348]|nr:hypothetical protein F4775DRAFT_551631 [Biscogniauxia sp. FL1348]
MGLFLTYVYRNSLSKGSGPKEKKQHRRQSDRGFFFLDLSDLNYPVLTHPEIQNVVGKIQNSNGGKDVGNSVTTGTPTIAQGGRLNCYDQYPSQIHPIFDTQLY